MGEESVTDLSATPVESGSGSGQRASVGRRVVSWLGLVAAIVVSIWFIALPIAYWLWVSWSAWFGVRASQDVGLGLISLALAVVPVAVSLGTWRLLRRVRLRPTRAAIALAAGSVAGLIVYLPGALSQI